MSTLTASRDREGSDVERLTAAVQALAERNRQLEQALHSRIVIEQAKGVLAERYAVDVDVAFDMLRRAARSNRLRLHDLAAETVASRETPAPIVELVP
jgi:AmiR/NasT family two-component response regulator